MSAELVVMRVDATCHITVEVGDELRRGQRITEAPAPAGPLSPVSGTVRSIQFDPGNHEFVIAIAPAT